MREFVGLICWSSWWIHMDGHSMWRALPPELKMGELPSTAKGNR